jgi:hypothetical protein
LLVACLTGAGVAALGALAAFRLLPGKEATADAGTDAPCVDCPEDLALATV